MDAVLLLKLLMDSRYSRVITVVPLKAMIGENSRSLQECVSESLCGKEREGIELVNRSLL